MLRNEASIRELFHRSCIADRSFVPQDDREMGYVIDTKELFANYSIDYAQLIDSSFRR
jgi:hypothetical protein